MYNKKLLSVTCVFDEQFPLSLQIPPTEACNKALMKMMYCPHCRGLTQTKPCNNYCLNTMKGCLAYHSELNSVWNDYIGKNSCCQRRNCTEKTRLVSDKWIKQLWPLMMIRYLFPTRCVRLLINISLEVVWIAIWNSCICVDILMAKVIGGKLGSWMCLCVCVFWNVFSSCEI